MNRMKTYKAGISFFINDKEPCCIEAKNNLVKELKTLKEVEIEDVYDDGEDWCVDCVVTIQSGATRKIDIAIGNKLIVLLPNVAWDFHYIKCPENNYEWCP